MPLLTESRSQRAAFSFRYRGGSSSRGDRGDKGDTEENRLFERRQPGDKR